MFTNESQEIIKQYLRFNLNENHDDDDESDCINADDINDDDQDAHSSIDGLMLKTVVNRIAKTLITLTTTLFIISIRLYSIL